jgi:peptidoglycan/LPS O-acetylase OafA/YrhL
VHSLSPEAGVPRENVASARSVHQPRSSVDPTLALYRKLEGKHVPSLDGFRAVAILLVLGLHIAYNFIPGRLGVEIFFVLSGFLITRLLLEEHRRTGAVSLRRFYGQRAFRIFPAYYVYGVVSICQYLPHPPWAKFLTCFLYVSNYASVWMRPDFPMAGSWSLSVEEQFYLLWPACFRRWIAGGGQHVIKILLAVVAAVQLWKVVLFFFGADREYLHAAFDTRCSDLLIGCLLAILLARRITIPSWLLHPAATLLPLSVLLLAVVCDALEWHTVAIAFFYTPAAIATAVLMVQSIVWSHTPPFSFLDWSWMRYIGKISYSLYLWHGIAMWIVVDILERSLREHGSRLAYRWHILLCFALSFLFAALSYQLIEQPFLKLRGRLISSR